MDIIYTYYTFFFFSDFEAFYERSCSCKFILEFENMFHFSDMDD